MPLFTDRTADWPAGGGPGEKVPFFRFLLYNNGIGKEGGGFVPKRRRSAQTPDWRFGARASAQSASARR